MPLTSPSPWSWKRTPSSPTVQTWPWARAGPGSPFSPSWVPGVLFWVMPKGSSKTWGCLDTPGHRGHRYGPTCRSYVQATIPTTEARGRGWNPVPPGPACPPALPRTQSPGCLHLGTRDPLTPSQIPTAPQSLFRSPTWDAPRLCLQVPWSQHKQEAPTSPGARTCSAAHLDHWPTPHRKARAPLLAQTLVSTPGCHGSNGTHEGAS